MRVEEEGEWGECCMYKHKYKYSTVVQDQVDEKDAAEYFKWVA